MAIVDTHIVVAYSTKLLADGIESIIEDFDNFIVTEKIPIEHVSSSLSRFVKEDKILIIELNCPKSHDLEFISALKKEGQVVKILLISNIARKELSSKILESGIDAYLLKSCSRHDILTALSKINSGQNYFCSEITKYYLCKSNRQLSSEDDKDLTEREGEILRLLVDGHTNKGVAVELGLSENTVKTHRRNIIAKFGVNNLLGMVRFACRSNLIDFGSDNFCKECPHCGEFQSN